MVTTASRWSYSPARSVRTSRLPRSRRSVTSSASASVRAVACSGSDSSASMAISTRVSRSSSRCWRFSRRSRSFCAWESFEVTRWAASGSSHRSGTDACSDSFAIRARRASGSVTARMVPSVLRRALISVGKSVATTVQATGRPDGRRSSTFRSDRCAKRADPSETCETGEGGSDRAAARCRRAGIRSSHLRSIRPFSREPLSEDASMPAATHVPGTTLPALEPITGWTLQAVAGPVPPEIAGRTVPATVPGSAHTDLLDAGLIPDPYLDMNETDLIWAHRTDWRYTSTFVAAPAADGERVDLVMQGLDTVATVTLNGQVVASTANQHRSYRVDVGRLQVGAPVPAEGARHLADHVERLEVAGVRAPDRLVGRLAQVRPLVTVVGGPDGTHVGRVTVHVAVEHADADAELTLRATVTGAPGTEH